MKNSSTKTKHIFRPGDLVFYDNAVHENHKGLAYLSHTGPDFGPRTEKLWAIEYAKEYGVITTWWEEGRELEHVCYGQCILDV